MKLEDLPLDSFIKERYKKTREIVAAEGFEVTQEEVNAILFLGINSVSVVEEKHERILKVNSALFRNKL